MRDDDTEKEVLDERTISAPRKGTVAFPRGFFYVAASRPVQVHICRHKKRQMRKSLHCSDQNVDKST